MQYLYICIYIYTIYIYSVYIYIIYVYIHNIDKFEEGESLVSQHWLQAWSPSWPLVLPLTRCEPLMSDFMMGRSPSLHLFKQKNMGMGQNPIPCSSHQNSWDLWMFIPLKMYL